MRPLNSEQDQRESGCKAIYPWREQNESKDEVNKLMQGMIDGSAIVSEKDSLDQWSRQGRPDKVQQLSMRFLTW